MDPLYLNGVEVELTKEGGLRAAEAMEGQEIELAWKGGTAKLTKEYLIPLE